jgi:hypothetical protein
MNEKDESKDACTMQPVDKQGKTNLCCCYVLDQDGTYTDPCYSPVEECCCCE